MSKEMQSFNFSRIYYILCSTATKCQTHKLLPLGRRVEYSKYTVIPY